MEQRITPYLQRLIDSGSTALLAQFRAIADKNGLSTFDSEDPLGEESRYSPVKGLVHKYKNRVLWKVSYRCAAHCQFCTRIRQIGSSEGDLGDGDINQGIEYLRSHPKVDDVILSGGDPLYTPLQTTRILGGLMGVESVRVIRIGTRLPVHSPQSMWTPPVTKLLDLAEKVASEKTFFFLVHVNHPDELAPETRKALKLLRQTGIPILSQTVFLRGINDDMGVLGQLFRELYYLGMIPYYIYRCDYVRGLERFVCDLAVERKIMTELRKTLSGIALPTYVVDVPGMGKLPVPLEFWDVPNPEQCRDFDGNIISL